MRQRIRHPVRDEAAVKDRTVEREANRLGGSQRSRDKSNRQASRRYRGIPNLVRCVECQAEFEKDTASPKCMDCR